MPHQNLLLLLFIPSVAAQSFVDVLHQFQGAVNPDATTTEEPETTENPCEYTTTDGYNAHGWKTDDDGNVYVGDDNAKLYLVANPGSEPFPWPGKDWPEALFFGSNFPDSPYYRGPPQTPVSPCYGPMFNANTAGAGAGNSATGGGQCCNPATGTRYTMPEDLGQYIPPALVINTEAPPVQYAAYPQYQYSNPQYSNPQYSNPQYSNPQYSIPQYSNPEPSTLPPLIDMPTLSPQTYGGGVPPAQYQLGSVNPMPVQFALTTAIPGQLGQNTVIPGQLGQNTVIQVSESTTVAPVTIPTLPPGTIQNVLRFVSKFLFL